MKTKTLMLQILILSIIAMGISGYLTYGHYASGTGFCLPGIKSSSCDTVNQSIYSEILGIPLAALGGLTFFIMALMSASFLFHEKVDKKSMIHGLAFVISASLIFVAWLIYVEFQFLEAFCTLCTILHLFILYMFFLIIHEITKEKELMIEQADFAPPIRYD